MVALHWAPMFEGPLLAPEADVAPYYAAYSALARFLADAEDAGRWTTRLRLRPGDVLCFNNRRMLHGRAAFAEPPRLVAAQH